MRWSPDPAFAATSHAVADLTLCHLRLQDDARYPWLILLPRVPHAVELTDLNAADQARLLEEIIQASMAVRRLGEHLERPVEKLNIAALGNVTPQLHIHIVGRRTDDEAWPAPVWGQGAARPYAAAGLPGLIQAVSGWLA